MPGPTAPALSSDQPAELPSARDAAVARAASRISIVYMLRSCRLMIQIGAGDLVTGMVFFAITSGNIAHIDYDPKTIGRYTSLDEVAPDELRRPVSALAVSNSLGLSYETTRRHITKLVKAERCTRVRGGLVADSRSVQMAGNSQLMLENVVNLRHFVRALTRTGFSFDWAAGSHMQGPTAPERRTDKPTLAPADTQARRDASVARAASRISIEFVLRGCQLMIRVGNGDPVTGLVYYAITSGNVAYIDHDPTTVGKYASLDDVVPDELRRPVSVLAAADSLGLPYETARRHVAKLVKAGRCLRTRGGLVADNRSIRTARNDAAILENMGNLRRLFRTLFSVGFSFD